MNLKIYNNLTVLGGGYLDSLENSKQYIRLLNPSTSWNLGGIYVLD